MNLESDEMAVISLRRKNVALINGDVYILCVPDTNWSAGFVSPGRAFQGTEMACGDDAVPVVKPLVLEIFRHYSGISPNTLEAVASPSSPSTPGRSFSGWGGLCGCLYSPSHR
jgi:hypothetical protein